MMRCFQNHKPYFVCLLLLFSLSSGYGQVEKTSNYPDNYFRDPLNIPLRLAGSFGELRGNHFHSGVDFKTHGKVGLPLYAAAKGHVARIKVSSGGFGKALYIRHPNGFTTVYAHMNRFNEAIAAYVKNEQYQRETYGLNLYPEKGQFSLEKGDLIGYSGNSGSSTGPHLHFEVRETRTEKPVNPLFFGFSVKDTRNPRIEGVRLYPLGKNSEINVRFDHHLKKQVISHDEAITLDVSRRGDEFSFENVKELCATGKVGVGVEVYDYQNNSPHDLGVYQIRLKDQKGMVFESTIDKFRFAQTRYINAHVDYAHKIKRGNKYQRCFVLPGNRLPFYKAPNRGHIQVNEENTPSLSMLIQDSYGNKATLNWNFNYIHKGERKPALDEGSSENKTHQHVTFPYDQKNTLDNSNIELEFPKGTFYDTVEFTFETTDRKKGYSQVFQVHNPYTPVQEYYKMAIQADKVPATYHDKAIIIHEQRNGQPESEGGRYQNGFIEANTRELGPFYIGVDTVKPTIRAVNFGKGTPFSGKIPMRIIIRDDLSGIDHYTPKIDGEWVRMAYDAKNDLLIFQDFERLKPGKHSLNLEVVDEKGNKATFQTKFKKL